MTRTPQDNPLTVGYLAKYIAPLLLILVGGVTWGVRLESVVDFQQQRIDEIEQQVEADNKFLDDLRLEQAKLSGQIETLKVMVSNVGDAIGRIERKLNGE